MENCCFLFFVFLFSPVMSFKKGNNKILHPVEYCTDYPLGGCYKGESCGQCTQSKWNRKGTSWVWLDLRPHALIRKWNLKDKIGLGWLAEHHRMYHKGLLLCRNSLSQKKKKSNCSPDLVKAAEIEYLVLTENSRTSCLAHINFKNLFLLF